MMAHTKYVNLLLTSPAFHLFVVVALLSSNHKFFQFEFLLSSYGHISFLSRRQQQQRHRLLFIQILFADYGHVNCESRVGERSRN